MTVQQFPSQAKRVTYAQLADSTHTFVAGPWEYFTSEERDDDVRKLSHFVVHQDTGETHEIDWTPYSFMSPPDVLRMADMGFPPRKVRMSAVGSTVSGPWNSEACELEWMRWRARQVPNQIPPGNAAPRYVQTDGASSYAWIFAAALTVLVMLAIFPFV